MNSIYALLQEMKKDLDASNIDSKTFLFRKNKLEKEIKTAKKNIALSAAVLEEYEKTKEMTSEQLSRRQFFQKAGKITKGALAVMLAGSTGLTAGIYTALLGLSKDLPLKKEEGLAILISKKTYNLYDEVIIKRLGRLFEPAYVARVEIAFGQKANLVKAKATSSDLFAVLENRAIQNIVIFGHGGWWFWEATDRAVITQELKERYRPENQKRGLFVRHTCGIWRYAKSGLPELLSSKEESNSLFNEWDEIVNESLNISEELQKKSADSLFLINFFTSPSDSRHSNGGKIDLIYHWKEKGEFKRQRIEIYNLADLEKAKEKYLLFFDTIYNDDDSQKGIRKKITSFFQRLAPFVQKITTIKIKELPLFGTPYYPPERINGWDRITTEVDFFIDVFGDKKLDQLYAKK